MAQVIKNRKGGKSLMYNGYSYQFHSNGSGKKIWLCTKSRYENCLARLYTAEEIPDDAEVEVLKEPNNHNHTPDAASIEKTALLNKVKQIANVSTDSTASIVATALQGASTSCLGKLPLVNSMKRNVRKIRQVKYQGNLKSPASRSELVIPEQLSMLSSGEDILKFDSGSNNQRILIFATNQTLDLLQGSDHWYCDGTFKASPSLFEQLFVIQGTFRGSVLPLVFVLMPNRTQATYNRVLEALMNLRPNLAPETIMSDFELAPLGAFHQAFPAARQRGCFFHFSQSVWKHIQQHPNLADNYRKDGDYALKIKMIAALAFLPPAKVAKAYDTLTARKFFDDEVPPGFLQYFESTWIGTFDRRQRRRSPSFAIPLWNCRQSVLDGLGKTNNICEGFNRAINSLLGAAHPTIFKFLDSLKKQQELTRAKIEAIVAGRGEEAGSSKYMSKAESLKKVVESYEEDEEQFDDEVNDDEEFLDKQAPNLFAFLQGVAHNIEYNV